MVLDHSRRNLPLMLLIASAVLLTFWLSQFFGLILPATDLVASEGIINSMFVTVGMSEFAQGVFSFIFSLCLAFLFYYVNNKHSVVQSREHLLVYIWVLLYAAFPQLYLNPDVHISVFFVILSLDCLFSIYHRDYDLPNVFMTAFLLALASVFYTLAAYLIFPIFIGLLVLKSVRWRELIVFIAGLFCPYYLIAFISYFFIDKSWGTPFGTLVHNLELDFPLQPNLSIFTYILIVYMLGLSIMETLNATRFRTSGTKQKTVAINTAFGWILFSSLVASFFYLPRHNSMLLFLFIPFTVFLANFFSYVKKDLWANIFFGLLVLLSALNAFGNLFGIN